MLEKVVIIFNLIDFPGPNFKANSDEVTSLRFSTRSPKVHKIERLNTDFAVKLIKKNRLSAQSESLNPRFNPIPTSTL
jgi:hypothetical protein